MIFDKYPEIIFVSSKVLDGNMSFLKGTPEGALGNKSKFFKSFKINPKNIVELKQVHGNKVVLIYDKLDADTEADGMITNKSGVYLMVKVADRIPAGLYDPKHHAIGLIHLGWRGLEKGLIKNAVKNMQQKFGTNPKDLIIQFGSSIGPCHYRMNLWVEAENQLIGLGVLKKNIDNPKICTYESNEYFSHRRANNTNQPDSRFVTILGLK